MAKRVIQECDLTKQEYDPEETVIITIKKKGKTKGRSYDLSPEAAAKLEQQLVADSGAELDEGWHFANGLAENQPVDLSPRQPDKAPVSTGTTFEEVAAATDEKMIAEKRASLKEAGVDEDDREEENPEPERALGSVDGNGCKHLNKGRIQTTLRKGKRHAYRVCRDCGAQIPEMTKAEKQDYMSGKLPADVNLKDR